MAQAQEVPPKSQSPYAVRGSRWVVVALAVVAGLVAAVISSFFLADSLAALGLPDPGPVTTWGLPGLRAALWVLMACAVGSFMAAAFFIAPLNDAPVEGAVLSRARLSVDGHIAARTGAWSALGVSVLALAEIPLVLSDLTGANIIRIMEPALFSQAYSQVSTARMWALTAAMALVVGVCGLVARTWTAQPLLLMGAMALMVPQGMEGHSAAGGDHDYGTNSYLWHLAFMLLWVGGLIGLLAHSRRRGPGMAVALRRYSAIALGSVIAMSISGLVNAAVRIEFSDWFTTRYGLIIVAKVVLTVALALCGFVHRQVCIPRIDSAPQLFRRVAIVELVLMAATVGVAGTMGRTPPPPPRDPNLNSMQILLGYELFEPATATNVWTMFRFDLLWGTIGLLLIAGYSYALLRVHRRGLSWEWTRTAWWMLGALSLVVIMSNGIGMYIPASYSMHMLGHMVLSMVVPLFLALGAPLTLLMEAFEAGAPGEPGIHEWVDALVHSRVVAFVTHPAVNLLQFLGVFYAMYLSFEFYEYAISEHAGHVLMNTAFILSGYFYFWELVGPDPIPNRRPTGLRLLLLFISMPIHLYAGVYLMQLGQILGENFYLSLDLPWQPDLAADQKVGGGIAWGFGQFPLVIVFGYLFREWLRDDRNLQRRHDAKAEIDGDADLADYNAMLAALNSDGDEQHYRQR